MHNDQWQASEVLGTANVYVVFLPATEYNDALRALRWPMDEYVDWDGSPTLHQRASNYLDDMLIALRNAARVTSVQLWQLDMANLDLAAGEVRQRYPNQYVRFPN